MLNTDRGGQGWPGAMRNSVVGSRIHRSAGGWGESSAPRRAGQPADRVSFGGTAISVSNS